MSGSGSRERRKEAVRMAIADVYEQRGGYMPTPPFGNERQDRIYTKEYQLWRHKYWVMEGLRKELEEVYGNKRTV